MKGNWKKKGKEATQAPQFEQQLFIHCKSVLPYLNFKDSFHFGFQVQFNFLSALSTTAILLVCRAPHHCVVSFVIWSSILNNKYFTTKKTRHEKYLCMVCFYSHDIYISVMWSYHMGVFIFDIHFISISIAILLFRVLIYEQRSIGIATTNWTENCIAETLFYWLNMTLVSKKILSVSL